MITKQNTENENENEKGDVEWVNENEIETEREFDLNNLIKALITQFSF